MILRRCQALQKSILANISKYLEPGGKIVYSTCSLEKDENEDVVNDFFG